jgi:uncharacterized membrane protein
MAFDHWAVARALHVIAVVHWIGGVLFVTFVALPAVQGFADAAERFALFDRIERKFAGQARVSTVVAGFAGFDLTHHMGAWNRFLDPTYWWMHAMVGLWLVFTVMLFIAEPLFLHRWFEARMKVAPEATFRLVRRMHLVLSTVSIVTILGVTMGAHGYFPF